MYSQKKKLKEIGHGTKRIHCWSKQNKIKKLTHRQCRGAMGWIHHAFSYVISFDSNARWLFCKFLRKYSTFHFHNKVYNFHIEVIYISILSSSTKFDSGFRRLNILNAILVPNIYTQPPCTLRERFCSSNVACYLNNNERTQLFPSFGKISSIQLVSMNKSLDFSFSRSQSRQIPE